MKSIRSTKTEDSLAAIVRREALLQSPQFSPALHARIMQAVSASKAVRASQLPQGAMKFGTRIWWLMPAAAAAAAALALLLILWHPHLHGSDIVKGPTPPAQNVQLPQLASLDLAFSKISEQESRLEGGLGHWAGLDHDAKVAARLVLDPLHVNSSKLLDSDVR